MENPKIKNKAKAHVRYKLKDGMAVPGVTTITGLRAKPGLVPWANKLGLEGVNVGQYVDELASIGSLAHYFVECNLSGKKADTGDYTENQMEQARVCVRKFEDWKKHHELEVILTESQFVSEKFQFGGTCDLYCKLDGKLTLIDLKTSKGLFPEHKIQVMAYAKLLEENGHPVEDVRIIRIGRNESEGFEDVNVGLNEKYWKLFRYLLEIYKLERELKKEER